MASDRRIDLYFAEAQRLRALATSFASADMRAQIIGIAEQYEALALQRRHFIDRGGDLFGNQGETE